MNAANEAWPRMRRGSAGVGWWASRAFSLMEVVLAMAVAAVGLVCTLGLFALSVRQAGELADLDTAMRLAGAVEAEIELLEFNDVQRRLIGRREAVDENLAWFADRDGVHLGDSADLAPAARYFAIVLERDHELSPASTDASAGYIMMQMRIEWPHRLATGARTAADNRQAQRFVHAVAR